MNTTPESSAMLSNAALVERYLDRDASAFTELFRRHRDMVYRVCLRFTSHHHDAEDLTQETFRRAATAIERWDPRRPLEPWLATIAGNRCRTLLANRRRETCWDSSAALTRCAHEADVIETYALSEQITIAMNQLPADQRRAFELVHQHDLSYPQAARLMGRSAGTVKTWVHRAKSSMRAVFQQSEIVAQSTRMPPKPSDSPLSQTAPSTLAKVRRASAISAASLLILWCGWSIRPQPSGRLGDAARFGALVESDRPVGDPCAGAMTPPRRAAPSLAEFAIDPSTLNPSALNPSLATVPEGFGLRWATDAVFAPARWTLSDVETIEIGRWIDHSAPTVLEMTAGVKPFGRTLRGLASLFSWHRPESIQNLDNQILIQADPIEGGISALNRTATPTELQT